MIQLPNKLEALIVHDPDTDKASAALDVHVGNFSDSDDLPVSYLISSHIFYPSIPSLPLTNEAMSNALLDTARRLFKVLASI